MKRPMLSTSELEREAEAVRAARLAAPARHATTLTVMRERRVEGTAVGWLLDCLREARLEAIAQEIAGLSAEEKARLRDALTRGG